MFPGKAHTPRGRWGWRAKFNPHVTFTSTFFFRPPPPPHTSFVCLLFFFFSLPHLPPLLSFKPRQILASASTNEKVMREALTNLSDKRASAHVGKIIAERAQAAAIPAVHFQKPKVGACG